MWAAAGWKHLICVAENKIDLFYILRLWLKYGACLCLIFSGDHSRHPFSPVFHGKRLHHVFTVGIHHHYHPVFALCVYVRTQMDFAVAKKEPSKRNRVGDWGSKRNWKIDGSSFSIQRFVLCYYLNFSFSSCSLNNFSNFEFSSMYWVKSQWKSSNRFDL